MINTKKEWTKDDKIAKTGKFHPFKNHELLKVTKLPTVLFFSKKKLVLRVDDPKNMYKLKENYDGEEA